MPVKITNIDKRVSWFQHKTDALIKKSNYIIDENTESTCSRNSQNWIQKSTIFKYFSSNRIQI